MRTAFILLTAGVLLVCAASADAQRGAQRRHPIGPLTCAGSVGGVTQAPFFGVTAVQNQGRSSLAVGGRYRMTEGTGRLTLTGAGRLTSVRTGGQTSRVLRLDLERRPGPRVRGGCLSFTGSFSAPAVRTVLIRDWRGRSVSVPVERPR
jgi:hypothetical protein